jgi:outer membrane receptor protein involved in Fe transport
MFACARPCRTASAASTFSGSLTDFFAGRPDSFRQTFGNPDTNYAVTSYGTFVQDHMALSPSLTMDIGLRYDFEQLPAGFDNDANNVSPRRISRWRRIRHSPGR